MKRAYLVGLFVFTIFSMVSNSFGWYDAKVGRWLSRDPAGEVDTPNLYNYVKNDPVNNFDPLGLWTVQFNGNWTGEQKNIFNARLNDVTRGIQQMITRTDQLITQAEKLSDGCCLKKELIKDLKSWKKNLLQVMDRRQKGSVPLPVVVRNFGGDPYGRANFNWKFAFGLLGGDLDTFTGMDVDAGFFSSSQATETLFHELSHISGTIDDDNKEPVSVLWNAHLIEGFITQGSIFTPTSYWSKLIAKYNNAAGCSQTDRRWPRN